MLRQLVGLLGYVLLFAVLLFGPAGTLDWPAAWILLATLFTARAVSTLFLWRTQRALLIARSAVPVPQAGQPLGDRLLLPLCMASFAGLVAFSAWDAWHGHLLRAPNAWIRWVGLSAFVAGWWIVHLSLSANAFAVTVVRHQQEREHVVIDGGPYAMVRHPMYAGLVPVMAGLALWLGSLAGAIFAILPVTLLALRILVEERMLLTRLPDYAAYTTRVRNRLIPWIW